LSSVRSNWKGRLTRSLPWRALISTAPAPNGVVTATERLSWYGFAMHLVLDLQTPTSGRCRHPLEHTGSFGRHELQASLVVLGVEVQAIGVASFGNDHTDDTFELLPRNCCGGYLIDPILFYIFRPARRIRRVDAGSGIGRAAHQADELVVVEFDHSRARHDYRDSLWKTAH